MRALFFNSEMEATWWLQVEEEPDVTWVVAAEMRTGCRGARAEAEASEEVTKLTQGEGTAAWTRASMGEVVEVVRSWVYFKNLLWDMKKQEEP